MKWLVSCIMIAIGWTPIALAAQPTPAQLQFFEAKIRPALIQYCYECHSVESGDSRAGLLVDTRQGLLQGGDSGPAIVPGDAAESVLWEAITWDGYRMPPSEKMPATVIADFKRWLDMGAPDPRVRELMEVKTKINHDEIEQARSDHWAFQSPRPRPGATIDGLVAEKLREQGLRASGAADVSTLLRRINFDLVGLPPTPAEIVAFRTAFQNDAENAWRSKVDELLRRPQYGQRWGRHWLDVARYAESSGSRSVRYPHAWRYRNYVIDAFNDDTPYDRFIAEQIAGDLLPVDSDQQWQENLIATGFLAIGLKHHDEKNPRKFMADMVDEQIDTTTQAVLGLTVACARCHDHKFDPIPTDDYYALAGIFYSTKTYYGTDRIGQNHRPSDLLLLPVADRTSQPSRQAQPSIRSLEGRVDALNDQLAGVRGKDRRQILNARNRVASQLASFNADGSKKPFGMGVQENDQFINANILLGGDVDRPAQEVARGFVQVLDDLNFTVDGDQSSGRLDLVKALTSKSNPLTARVMVNRIWMHLFGRPLVETPSNFGLSGVKPVNQALLDHLAVRFMQLDWSIQSMIREITMSETYRQDSRYDAASYEVDPDNQFLWRMNPRPIDAESMRDAMLSFSGRLNLEQPDGTQSGSDRGRSGPPSSRDASTHRSVYLPIVRDELPEELDLFDFPDPNTSSPGRSESIVPTQALYLMNGDFIATQAAGLSETLTNRFDSVGDRVRAAFLWVYGRPATQDEMRAAEAFFREYPDPTDRFVSANPTNAETQPRSLVQRGRGRIGGPPGRGGRLGGSGPREGSLGRQAVRNQPSTLTVFCQTLMASARFRILN
ncbi:MAG: PSD1 and planctomycete cytochrome C domain-containing protein [Planctomycetota bacterium]